MEESLPESQVTARTERSTPKAQAGRIFLPQGGDSFYVRNVSRVRFLLWRTRSSGAADSRSERGWQDRSWSCHACSQDCTGVDMIIKQRRIRNLNNHLGFLEPGAQIVIGIRDPDQYMVLLRRMGFVDGPEVGASILPAPEFGPISRFNANGKNIIHRDQPMETAYRSVQWHWTECHGQNRVEQSDWRDVSYQRYPRTFVPPPSIEFTISARNDGGCVLASPPLAYAEENRDRLVHVINLFLEIFGQCEVFDHHLDQHINAPLRRLNWVVLPEGRWPWEKLEPRLEPIIRAEPDGNQPLIRDRLQTVSKYDPEFVAVGRGGFSGYVIFGFPQKSLFVLECMHINNATYVLGEGWEKLSQMTKAEILDEHLHEARLVHLQGWHGRLERLLGGLR
jgi:hypothetical protein